MMYSENFVMTIHDARGKVLRENRNKEVFMPFGSEYSLRLRNNNSKKATAEVSIDGTDVLGNNLLIVDSHSYVDLERFCINGDLRSGNKFMFVEAGSDNPHPDVQDPDSYENGIISVRFRLEKPVRCPRSPEITRRTKGSKGLDQTFSSEPSASVDSLYRGVGIVSEDWEPNDSIIEETGATVEGGSSSQVFRYGSIGQLEKLYTEIELKIRPSSNSVTVRDTRNKYCIYCGAKCKFCANFCSLCGSGLSFSKPFRSKIINT